MKTVLLSIVWFIAGYTVAAYDIQRILDDVDTKAATGAASAERRATGAADAPPHSNHGVTLP